MAEISNWLSGVSVGVGHDGGDELTDFLDLLLAPGGDEVAGEYRSG